MATYTLQDVNNIFAKTGNTLASQYSSIDPNILYLQAQSDVLTAGNYERIKDSRGEGILDTTTGQIVAGINMGEGAAVLDEAKAQAISAQKRADQGIVLGQTIATAPTAANPTGFSTPAQAPTTGAGQQTEAQRQATFAAAGQQPVAETPPGTAPTTPPAAPASTYTGPSIVDYLASIGQPSDFASRALLAQKLGIQNYSGTAAQNTQMLDTLRKGQAPAAPATPPATGGATGGGTAGAGTGTPGATGTGTTGGTTGGGTPATPKSFIELYKEALTASGLSSIKEQFDKTQKAYDDLQNELNDKIAEVNANPWLSESLRISQNKKLQEKYEGKMTILTNKLKLYDSLHQQAQAEARFIASGIQEDQQKMMEHAEKEQAALAKLAEQDIHQVDVGGRSVLVDYKTKKIVADLGPSKDPNASEDYKPPTSYQEWTLAGKPGTYEQWLKSSSGKPPTAAQETVSTYASRIEQSNPTIESLTPAIAKMSPLTYEAQVRLPSYLQSAEFQQYDQAARNFINATLRRESGAVISPSEFENAYKQYLPRPSDTPETLAQKKLNREIVYGSFKKAAGSAYQSIDELISGQSADNDPLGVR